MPLYDANGEIIAQPDIHDPQGIPPEDVALLNAMADEMRALQTGEPMIIGLSPVSAVQVAGLLQLALRHDGTAGDIRATALRFLDGVRAYFADCPAVLEILRRGDDPAHDFRPGREGAKDFHAHLDACRQCADNPFGLCATGQRLLRSAVDASDRP